MSGYTKGHEEIEELRSREPHRPCRYKICREDFKGDTTKHVVSEQWVHCPICACVNDGHSPDKRARYLGGMLYAEIPDEGGNLYSTAMACRCREGVELNRDTGAAFYDTVRPELIVSRKYRIMIDKQRKPALDTPPDS